MHTNKDGRQDECMLIRNTRKEFLCKFNQEQNTSTGVFFFLCLFSFIRLSYFPQARIFWLFLQLSKPHRNFYINSNATTCNTLLYKLGILVSTKGSCSEIKMAVQYFCSSSSFGRTDYFTCYLTLLKEWNISSAALLKDVFFSQYLFCVAFHRQPTPIIMCTSTSTTRACPAQPSWTAYRLIMPVHLLWWRLSPSAQILNV